VATKRTADAVSVLAARRDNRDAVDLPRHFTALRAVTAPAVRTQRRRPKVVRIDWAAPSTPAGPLSRPQAS